MSVKILIRTLAPEFNATKDEVVETWIELTEPYVSEKKFGKFYPQALAYLTAHKMKMAGLGDNTYGTIAETLRVASFNEGETAIAFNTSQATNILTDSDLSLSTYGISYIAIRRLVIVPIKTAGGINYG